MSADRTHPDSSPVELPPLRPFDTCDCDGCPEKVYYDDGSYVTVEEAEARERILLARVAELESVLSETVALYGKPGGPWNITSDPGGWLERARAAIDAARGAK